ncbi:MAG: rhodanese-like domain-containing protein [Candidatus Latescibacterota bacterium]|jgi:rhodanese-related sulfurtransferase
MNQFAKSLAGGVALILAAAVIGVVHNAVRGQSIPLIQQVKAVQTAQRGNGGDSPGQQASNMNSAELPEGAISIEEVKSLLDSGTAFFIDARAAGPFEKGHIPGALNIPYDRLNEYYAELTATVPPDAKVVCYCWSPTCDFSDQLATELKIMGYTDVVVFTGGWEEWQATGHPVEGSEVEE